jgi:hypothetical protein
MQHCETSGIRGAALLLHGALPAWCTYRRAVQSRSTPMSTSKRQCTAHAPRRLGCWHRTVAAVIALPHQRTAATSRATPASVPSPVLRPSSVLHLSKTPCQKPSMPPPGHQGTSACKLKRHMAVEHSTYTVTWPLTLTNPMSFASSRKLCLLMFSPYLRIRPQWLPDTRLQRHADAGLSYGTALKRAQGAAHAPAQAAACAAAQSTSGAAAPATDTGYGTAAIWSVHARRAPHCAASPQHGSHLPKLLAHPRALRVVQEPVQCTARRDSPHNPSKAALTTSLGGCNVSMFVSKKAAKSSGLHSPLAAALAIALRVRVPHLVVTHAGCFTPVAVGVKGSKPQEASAQLRFATHGRREWRFTICERASNNVVYFSCAAGAGVRAAECTSPR